MSTSGRWAQSSPRIAAHADGAVRVARDGRELLAYRYGDDALYPYCHPVNLPDGPPITLHRPFDHPWHVGLYFAWKYVNGLNVWEGPGSGEPHGGTRHISLDTVEDERSGAGVRHTIAWVGEGGEPLLSDERLVLVRPGEEPDCYRIDWMLRCEPLTDRVYLDRKVEWGGYAGLGVRLPRSFVRPSVLNAEGDTSTDRTHAASSAWTDYSGWIDGRDRPSWGGVTMIDHPSNPRFPTPWLTYDVRELQYLNAAPLRDEPLELRRGDVLRLAYRVLVHWGRGDPGLIDAEARDFARMDPHEEMVRLDGQGSGTR